MSLMYVDVHYIVHAYPHTYYAELEAEGIGKRADGKYYLIDGYADPDDEGMIVVIAWDIAEAWDIAGVFCDRLSMQVFVHQAHTHACACAFLHHRSCVFNAYVYIG